MKRAFTLVELLVVIGILGVLMGTLIVSVAGSTESARSAKCLSNMRSLATGCYTKAMEGGHYPLAASSETLSIDAHKLRQGKASTYKQHQPGWISRTESGSRPSAYGENFEEQYYCITNGSIWKAVGENTEVYVCPSHIKAGGRRPSWSYQMNGFFGGDVNWDGKHASSKSMGDKGVRPDKRLLFAEMPFGDTNQPYDDTAIQYRDLKNASASEELAFNHKSGKRACAHVVFADCHVEKLLATRGGDGDLAEIMSWLCQGLDISFNGSDYEKLDN